MAFAISNNFPKHYENCSIISHSFFFQNREAMEKLEELETSNNHLIKRLDKLKNAKSALLKDLWPLYGYERVSQINDTSPQPPSKVDIENSGTNSYTSPKQPHSSYNANDDDSSNNGTTKINGSSHHNNANGHWIDWWPTTTMMMGLCRDFISFSLHICLLCCCVVAMLEIRVSQSVSQVKQLVMHIFLINKNRN